ncbi:MAG: hypothetical protein IJ128_08100, partial [Firmicutes bacterium]|nr:hypothetical protein [Bacillota bacterium]
WVGATQVSEVNYKDIFGNGTTKYTGDGSEGTLTLDGAYIAGITSQLEGGLKILVNSNSVVNVDADHGIYSAGPLMISGVGRLSVQGEDGIVCKSNVTISDANVIADGDTFGNGITVDGNINIKSSKVKSTGMEYGIKAMDVIINGNNSVVTARADSRDGSAIAASGNISLNDRLTVVSPTGGTIGKAGTVTTILDKKGISTNEAVISGPSAYDVWVGETQVTSTNYTDVLGDGSVSYDPDKNILAFAGKTPAIEGVHSGAMIYAESDLLIIAMDDELTLENADAAQGINCSGDLRMLGNVTIGVKNQAISGGGDISVSGDLTARGMGSEQTTDGLIEAKGDVSISGKLSGYNEAGYGLRADGSVDISDDVRLTVTSGSVIDSGGAIEIAGNLDNTLFEDKSFVSENGITADWDIVLGGYVNLLTEGTGISSIKGHIDMVTGKWEVNNASTGTAAMDAVKINIPDTHGIIDPAGGEVKKYTSGEETRETIYNGSDVAGFAVIDWTSPKPAAEPGAPTVQVSPAVTEMTYADKGRSLKANVTVDPESGLGTLHYLWQRQEENGYWMSVASGVNLNEYTISENEAVGEYKYRCLVTNMLDGSSKQAVSDAVTVSIAKADAEIITEPRMISLTYNGKLQRLAMSGSASGGTMLYSLDNEKWSSSVPTARNAGMYKLYYIVQGDENHNDLSGGQLEVSVAKRKLVITADPKEKKEGQADPVLTFISEGLASGDKLVGKLTREKGEAVGTYLISSQSIEPAAYCKGNYTLVSQGSVLTINPADGGSDDAVKKVRTVTVNVKTVSAAAINKAVAKAGGSNKYVTTIVLGKKVKKISKGAFRKYTKVKTLVVKSKKLKKAKVKKALKGSKITKVRVKVGKKKTNKQYVKKYKKIFTKKIVGKKVKVSL